MVENNSNEHFISPIAKKMAEEAELDIAKIKGTGANNKILKSDVEQAIEEKNKLNSLLEDEGDNKKLPLVPDFQDIQISATRKIAIDKVIEANQEIPHMTMSIECEMEELNKVQNDLNQKAENLGFNYRLSYIDFMVKAASIALRRVPEVNVLMYNKSIRSFDTVDISLDVYTDNGITSPIIKNADKRRLPDVSRTIKYLTLKASENKLLKEEYQGGNFSIIDLGGYKVKNFRPSIKPHQSATLGIGIIEPRIIVKNGAIAVSKMVTCTLSVDNRCIDTNKAAEFLSVFKDILEDPLVMML